jgi:hypothetical protein
MVATAKAISLSEMKAAPGMFRAVIVIDSEPYQVGTDVSSAHEAEELCLMTRYDAWAVYDDTGQTPSRRNQQ